MMAFETLFRLPRVRLILALSAFASCLPSNHAFAADNDIPPPSTSITAEQIMGDEEGFKYTPFTLDELESKINFALKQNDAPTQYILGRMYEDGEGVNIDYTIAVQWFESAAENGYFPAMLKLGRIYLTGAETVPANPARALTWLQQAEKTGNPRSFYELGYYYENVGGISQNFEKAFQYYAKAAKAGIQNAHVKLGLFYQYGYGVEPNISMALKHYNLLADLTKDNNVKTYVKSIRAAIYDEIAGQQSDPKEQFKWTEISAQEGAANAMVRLGDFYRSGIGTEVDYKKAAGWYAKAAQLDNHDAMTNLGYLYMNGYGVEKDFTKALEWFRTAAEMGNPLAAWNVGNIYLNGYGVKPDKTESDKWFSRSEGLQQKQKGQ